MEGFVTLGTEVPWIRKRPGEVLDYVADLSDWLGTGETLASVGGVAGTGLTVVSIPAPAINAAPLTVTLSDGSAKTLATGEAAVIWLSGGTAGSRYDVTITCPVAGSPRVVQRTFQVRVVE
mgnify:CR=1 FL=1